MNDEFKGKSGKVKVMYVRGEDEGQKGSRAPNPVPAKAAVLLRARKIIVVPGLVADVIMKRVAVTPVLVADVIVKKVAAVPVVVTTANPRVAMKIHRGALFRVHRLVKKACLMRRVAASLLSIRSRFAVSVRKRRAFTVKMPVRHCSRVVLKASYVPGLCRA